MDSINSHINVKNLLSFEWDYSGICSYNRFGVISKNIFKDLKKQGKYSYFFILQLILTTLLNTCIHVKKISKKLPGEAGNVPLVLDKKKR